MRDLRSSPRALAQAAAALEARGDRSNALQARLVAVRRLLLLGRLDDAEAALARVDVNGLAPSLLAVAELAAAELALRSLKTTPARAALCSCAASRRTCPRAGALGRGRRSRCRARPRRRAPCRGRSGTDRCGSKMSKRCTPSSALIVDACRRTLSSRAVRLPLARRPVLFTLALVLAEAWPHDVDRRVLIERAFRMRRPDESHRARLRVEIGRLRALSKPLARIEASERGFKLTPRSDRVVVLLPPMIASRSARCRRNCAPGAVLHEQPQRDAVGVDLLDAEQLGRGQHVAGVVLGLAHLPGRRRGRPAGSSRGRRRRRRARRGRRPTTASSGCRRGGSRRSARATPSRPGRERPSCAA